MAVNGRKVIRISDRRRGTEITLDRRMTYITVIVAIILGVALAFMPNAYKITINGTEVGAVKNKKIIDKCKETVITQLKEAYNAEVKFEEEPVIKKYRAKKKDYIDPTYLISYMRKHMNILVQFKEIYVDGKAVGVIETESQLGELKKALKEKYYGDSNVEVEFGKKVEVKDKFAKESELMNIDKLVDKCTATTPKVVDYEVQPGDTLSGIAAKLGTTVENVVKANNDFTEHVVLRAGQKIKANVNEPLLPLQIVQKSSAADTTQSQQKAE